MESSTLLNHPNCLLPKPNQRWENAKKSNHHSLIYASIGVGFFFPAACVSFTGCIGSLFFLNEHPYLQSAAIISGFIIPSIFLVLGVACELIKRDIKNDILWTVNDIEAFNTTLLDVPLYAIDNRVRKVAAMSGVISFENYKSWCDLSYKQRHFEEERIQSFNLLIDPAELFGKLNEERKHLVEEKIKLEKQWNQLKKALLTDLPTNLI